MYSKKSTYSFIEGKYFLVLLFVFFFNFAFSQEENKEEVEFEDVEESTSEPIPEKFYNVEDSINSLDDIDKVNLEELNDTTIIDYNYLFDDIKKESEENSKRKGKKREKKVIKRDLEIPYFEDYQKALNEPLEPLFESSYMSDIRRNSRPNEFGISIGFSSIYSQLVNTEYQGFSTGVYTLMYRINVSDGTSIGLDLGYENMQPDIIDPKINTPLEYKELTVDGSSQFFYDQFFMMGYAKWIYKKIQFMELYSGMHLGFMSLNNNLKDEKAPIFTNFAYQIDLGGLALGVGANFKFFIEAGFGNMGKFKFGMFYLY